jgi:hypothetical protein
MPWESKYVTFFCCNLIPKGEEQKKTLKGQIQKLSIRLYQIPKVGGFPSDKINNTSSTHVKFCLIKKKDSHGPWICLMALPRGKRLSIGDGCGHKTLA